ncbi:polysaccharide pyruvyl transferase family protein [Oceanobacillus sp. J11TS1]|uniref:polysaccharide pyruvyl transferase family protein n=1 Tax=Oceanobacillus sp. J11TS1 TaxID=2807191 RepID=UPI001B025D9A|nr:polysaccharide pyruvyl transferase family protein [Oceanobacillus sp. J11TS1]GIO21496.1 polysaccharide pyruvyl transferase CsaB [Oceanobacillus sp. J11TS1]
MKKVLYIGWIGFKNLGDDLLWNIFENLSKKHLKESEMTIIPSFPSVDINNIEEYDLVVLGGGSLLTPYYVGILHKALTMNKKVIIWGSGIDRIKEQKLNMMMEGESPALNEIFSYEDALLLREVFSGASFGGVRGPLTKKALELLGVNEKDIQIIGDPGVLLKSDINIEKEKKEKIIGINWGTAKNNLYGNEPILEKKLINICERLKNRGYKILIYTVWKGDIPACKRLFNKINDGKNVTLDTTLYTEQELISLLSTCTLTINFKLHPNLLSLAANVPYIALGYRFKAFDLSQSLNLENYVLSTNSSDLENEVLKKVRLIERNSEAIINKYERVQKVYHPLIVTPFLNNLYI